MNINAIRIGNNPPDDVNVIIEVPIGGDPIKYEMDNASECARSYVINNQRARRASTM
jgi:inorganic pyrophosphatase